MLLRLGADDSRQRRSKLRAFEIILLLHVCTSTWWWAGGGWWKPTGDWSWIDASLLATLVFSTALTALGLHPRSREIALPGIAVLHATVIVNTSPETANHTYLEFFTLVLLAFFRHREESEEQLLLGSLRWVAVVVFFYAGLQKLTHGYYADGIFLAFQLQNPGFAAGLGWLVSTEELARIGAYTHAVGDGPYRIASPFLWVLSNSVYLWEMSVGALLALPRTRFLAVCASAVFLIITEAMAHEFFFGALYINVLLLFLRTDLNRRLIWVFAGFDVWVIAMKLELLPSVVTY